MAILLIGDGMGYGAIEAASRFRHGRPDALAMHTLPRRGELQTSKLEPLTDSAAAATAMATGVLTMNGHLGLDPAGVAVENLLELAHRRGLAVGLVTTAEVVDETPAAFSVHGLKWDDKGQLQDRLIQARPEVLLGGGARYMPTGFPNSRRDLPVVVRDKAALFDAVASGASELWGLFSQQHIPFELVRRKKSWVPSLAEMTEAALRTLDRDPHGFVLVIEGARIDMAAHNNLPRKLTLETLAFDDAVAEVLEWASSRPDVLVLVTADHETGNVRVVEPAANDSWPDLEFGTGEHTAEPVPVFGRGPGSEVFDGQLRDPRWIHAVIAAHLGEEISEPPEL